MNDTKTADQGDTLKELQDLLEKDVMTSSDDDDRLISKRERNITIIRFSIFFVMAIAFYFGGLFDRISVVVVAVVAYAAWEAFFLWRSAKSRKKKISFDLKKK